VTILSENRLVTKNHGTEVSLSGEDQKRRVKLTDYCLLYRKVSWRGPTSRQSTEIRGKKTD